MVIAAILGGGVGARMGNVNTPKQYLPLGGRPILVHAAEKFLTHPQVEHIIVLAPPAWLGFTQDILNEHLPKNHGVAVAAGGKKRSDTLRRALDWVKERFGDEEDHILLTHDAVRPFVTHRIIGGNIAAAREHGACGTAVPATDTILCSEDGAFVGSIPPRRDMYQMQTPQTFRCNKLRALMNSLRPEEEAALTDACMIYALCGERVAITPGLTRNIKITYPDDMATARALLEAEKTLNTGGKSL